MLEIAPAIAGPAALSDGVDQAGGPRERIAWIDIAKGVGIVLVVVGHALGGLIDSAGVGMLPSAYRVAFVAIYTFHMPLFFLLSGLLVRDRIARDGRRFVTGMGRTLVWPYFLWSTVQISLIAALGNAVNRPVADYWRTLAALPVQPVSQFWFLYVLLLLHLGTMAGLRGLGALTVFLIALTLKPLATLVPLPNVLLYAALEAPYYALGMYLGTAGVREVIVGRGAVARLAVMPLLAVLLITAATIAAPTFEPAIDFARTPAAGLARLAWHLAALPAALAGTFAVVGLAASLPPGRLGDGLAALGRWSMPIFVLHIMVIAGTRILCTKVLHLPYPGAILTIGVVLGVAVPAVVFVILRRLGLARPLGLA